MLLKEKEDMNFQEYKEKRLASNSEEENNEHVLNDLFEVNGIYSEGRIPLFVGVIVPPFGKKYAYIKQIRCISSMENEVCNIIKYPYDNGDMPKLNAHIGNFFDEDDLYKSAVFTVSRNKRMRKDNWSDLLEVSNYWTLHELGINEYASFYDIRKALINDRRFEMYAQSLIRIQERDTRTKIHKLEVVLCQLEAEREKRLDVKKELDDLVKQKEAMDKVIPELSSTLDSLRNEVNGLNEKKTEKAELEKVLPGLRSEKEKLEKRKDDLISEIDKYKEEGDMLRSLGLFCDNSSLQTDDVKTEPFSGSFSQLISHAELYMKASPKHLVYNHEERIVERFFNTMFTNQLIILSGEPGSGKTSLPVAVAKAIGAECHLISVQPNWTDNQDLLGFYNPIEKRYISTPFLEALLAARNNPERIHFICLDEMNLAHIEYYFSGILSAMETEEKELSLYVGKTDTELAAIICNKYYPEFLQVDKSKREEWIAEQRKNIEVSDLVKQWKMAKEYPPSICIPGNVVFVGTLNMDETTKGISPKVLDRSYIIEISNYDADIQGDDLQSDDVLSKAITPEAFLELRRATGSDNHNDLQKDITSQIKEILKVWNNQKTDKEVDGLREINLSKRFLREQLPAMMESDSSMSLVDILAGKILPLMQCDRMPEENRKKVEEIIKKECKKDKYAINKYNRMADDNDGISFWWR